jgi:hypothetical protein
MDEKLVREFWKLMEDKDVSKFLLAVFIEWVRKRRKEVLRDNRGRSIKPLFFLHFQTRLPKK